VVCNGIYCSAKAKQVFCKCALEFCFRKEIL